MEVVEIREDNEQEVAGLAVQALGEGKVIVCPTDTVYGLLADAANAEAVERVLQIKGREKGKPLSVFVKDIAAAKELAEILPEQEFYVHDVWPGKVTLVLKSKHALSEAFEKEGTIGIRIPRHSLLNRVMEYFGKPLTGTSANISDQPSCLDSKELIAQFQGREYQPDLLLDAGTLPESRPSAVVDITKAPYRTLR